MRKGRGFIYHNNLDNRQDRYFWTGAVNYWLYDFYLDLLPDDCYFNRDLLPDDKDYNNQNRDRYYYIRNNLSSVVRDEELIPKFAHYAPDSPESAYLEKIAPPNKLSDYEKYTPYHFAGLASKICSDFRKTPTEPSSYISKNWKLLNDIWDPDEILKKPEYAEEYFYILEAIQLINKSLSVRGSQRITNVFYTDPMGWAIPVEVCESKPRRESEGKIGKDTLGVYVCWDDSRTQNYPAAGTKYPFNIHSRIVLCLEPIRNYIKGLMVTGEKGLPEDISDFSRRKLDDYGYDLYKLRERLNRKNDEEYSSDCYSAADYNVIRDFYIHTHIYAGILAHELFHAWQDYHVGLLQHSRTPNVPKWLDDESETLAEFYSINYVWSILKDKKTAYRLYAKRQEEEKNSCKNEYTEVIRRRVLYMDGYKEFFPELSKWEDEIIKACY